MTPEELGEKFEKEWSVRTDYFNHRLGAFNDLKNWIVENAKKVKPQKV